MPTMQNRENPPDALSPSFICSCSCSILAVHVVFTCKSPPLPSRSPCSFSFPTLPVPTLFHVPTLWNIPRPNHPHLHLHPSTSTPKEKKNTRTEATANAIQPSFLLPFLSFVSFFTCLSSRCDFRGVFSIPVASVSVSFPYSFEAGTGD